MWGAGTLPTLERGTRTLIAADTEGVKDSPVSLLRIAGADGFAPEVPIVLGSISPVVLDPRDRVDTRIGIAVGVVAGQRHGWRGHRAVRHRARSSEVGSSAACPIAVDLVAEYRGANDVVNNGYTAAEGFAYLVALIGHPDPARREDGAHQLGVARADPEEWPRPPPQPQLLCGSPCGAARYAHYV